jgi:hypothetical protein
MRHRRESPCRSCLPQDTSGRSRPESRLALRKSLWFRIRHHIWHIFGFRRPDPQSCRNSQLYTYMFPFKRLKKLLNLSSLSRLSCPWRATFQLGTIHTWGRIMNPARFDSNQPCKHRTDLKIDVNYGHQKLTIIRRHSVNRTFLAGEPDRVKIGSIILFLAGVWSLNGYNRTLCACK